MIEVDKMYDFLPGIDKQAYAEYSKRAIAALLKVPGLCEIRSYRNLLGSPQVRLTLFFETLADWANFGDSPERHKLDAELLEFTPGFTIQLWGPSPALPQPLHPDR